MISRQTLTSQILGRKEREHAYVNHIKGHRWLLQGFSTADKVELYGFGDASQKAYVLAVYLCTESEDGNRIYNLIMAK